MRDGKATNYPWTLGKTLMSTPPTPPDPDDETTAEDLPLSLKIFLAVIGVIVVGFVVLHLAGRGLGGH